MTGFACIDAAGYDVKPAETLFPSQMGPKDRYEPVC